jgi:hypothetical protein
MSNDKKTGVFAGLPFGQSNRTAPTVLHAIMNSVGSQARHATGLGCSIFSNVGKGHGIKSIRGISGSIDARRQGTPL